MINSYFIKETHSTNDVLKEMLRKEKLAEGYVVYTDFQTVGKGQTGSSWESEKGKNLLFSILLYPHQVPIDQLFLISQLVSVAIKRVLDNYSDGITVKWPNDIYWNEKKLAGILIENALQGNKVKSIIGIGINVNQSIFLSDAPNPVSLRQITGKSINRTKLLADIIQAITRFYSALDTKSLRESYSEILYRKGGFYQYKTDSDHFTARIVEIKPDGQLILESETGEQKGFYFKEVKFI